MSQPSSPGALSYYLDKSNPAAWKAIGALSKAAGDDARAAGLSPELVELVCLRVSQINGCAYCLHVHTKKAIAAGVSDQRRALLAAWEESDLYSDVEKAALRLAEAVTTLHPAEDRDFAQIFGYSFLTPQQYGAVQWLAITMNATNRISILSHHPVPAESYGGSES
ncbi:carboxymuconolactone decarboxylase family protein [Falsarthrobacter nasiphocae]|uniref:AhpD family alkylhydroperoxidase n=1 Tax=Falsarthrobacter nasiphocae TaxID=189863 RepID=A0AAE3YEX1_9MICC|nr:carboxymuconolactone decarboxylase family protein [Falsarthrobacter nasiphocae]MDR6891960.1 AhpD family alkylhydroperoxidase [Falsarthrobacter nasiphocae]